MACTFCEIIAGRIAAFRVHEDDHVLAILDHRPIFEGHTLVLTKAHVEVLTDLPPPEIGPFFERVQRLAGACQTGLEADGTFVAINNRISQSVPHLHVHVVPRRRKDGLRGFFWPRGKYASPERAEEVRQRVAAALHVGH